ncbi:MAG: MoxR family ATPase [Endomicrobiia bacterium]|nr:MoxR family ATPase [Endomicrobiia bacterium]
MKNKETADELVEKLQKAGQAVKSELSKKIVGQNEAVDQLLVSLFSRGHCLIVGVPGLAKTLLVSTLSEILGLKFSRIQFTPDLMPGDITGTEIIQEDPVTLRKVFKFIPGPVFTQILLADEINRTPPKTQSALLEAMQEMKVTSGGKTYELAPPFFVLATQNPIEQEGTYPLPEAQLDRFFFQINISYPTMEEEKIIALTTTSGASAAVGKILGATDITALQDIVRQVPVSDYILERVVRMVRATRPDGKASGNASKYIQWGAGPRGTQSVILAAKAHAILNARMTVSKEDVAAVIGPALRHRMILNYTAEAEGVTADALISSIFSRHFDERAS